MPRGWIARVPPLIAWAGASVLVGLGLGGRMPTARAQAGTPPAFPSQASVVTVDVVVVDAKGQSIEGLTKDDFSLEEDGKPQTIVNFEAVSVPAEAAAGATTPADSGPIVTNAAAEAMTGRAFALLADDLSFPGEQSLQIRQALTRFINESLGIGRHGDPRHHERRHVVEGSAARRTCETFCRWSIASRGATPIPACEST